MQPAPAPAPADNLHEHAVQAEKHLEQLATGLAQAGADDGTISTVTKMAEVTRKVVMALGKGQAATGDHAPPAAQPHTMASATDALHQDAQAAAAQRPY